MICNEISSELQSQELKLGIGQYSDTRRWEYSRLEMIGDVDRAKEAATQVFASIKLYHSQKK